MAQQLHLKVCTQQDRYTWLPKDTFQNIHSSIPPKSQNWKQPGSPSTVEEMNKDGSIFLKWNITQQWKRINHHYIQYNGWDSET